MKRPSGGASPAKPTREADQLLELRKPEGRAAHAHARQHELRRCDVAALAVGPQREAHGLRELVGRVGPGAERLRGRAPQKRSEAIRSARRAAPEASRHWQSRGLFPVFPRARGVPRVAGGGSREGPLQWMRRALRRDRPTCGHLHEAAQRASIGIRRHQKAPGGTRRHQKASERIRTHQNASERIRTHLGEAARVAVASAALELLEDGGLSKRLVEEGQFGGGLRPRRELRVQPRHRAPVL